MAIEKLTNDLVLAHFEDILTLEQQYDVELQMNAHSRFAIYSFPYTSYVYMSDERILGEVFGMPLEFLAQIEPRLEAYLAGWNKHNTFYDFTNALHPDARGQGLMPQLVERLMIDASQTHEHFIGHFKEGSMSNIMDRFGAEQLHAFENFHETGNTYNLKSIDLSKFCS